MKKITTLLLLLVLSVLSSFGQTPMFFNTNAAGGGNVFPFGNTGASRKVQWFIPANSLTGVTPGNNITKVWFQSGSTSTTTYPILTIKLKQGTGTGLTGTASGPIEPAMVVVYTGVNVPVVSTTGGWFGFVLQTPWLYNPNAPLIVEVEHNSTTSTSQQIYQAVNIPGPGNGRQWADYNVATLTGVGAQQVNFGVDVLPATPCTGIPASNTIIPGSYTTCPFISNPNLSLTATYSFGGLTYSWQSSTISAVGPFNTINGATLSTAPVPTINTTTWFQAIVTCTNPGGGSTTITANQFSVGGSVVSSVPYYEDFEGVQSNNRLPNCSWYAPNVGGSVQTYLSSQSNNRVPLSGTKFGSFGLPSASNPIYSNGITMNPGITYSAGIWYATEYFGYNNWSSLELLVGPNQSTTGLVPIASVGPAVSGPYKLLSGTFTVPSSGNYYICIRATGLSGSALYLSFDDLFVNIPCYGPGAGNNPALVTSPASNTICAGDMLNCTASGANTYLWYDGSTGAVNVSTPLTSTILTVTGTNTLTGCALTNSINITVNPSPNVFIVASKPSVCKGENTFLTGYGANSFAWSTGGNGPNISVSPTVNATYSVIGTNGNGCATTATTNITIKPQPTVTALGLSNAETCAGETVSFQANGAAIYKWYSSSSNQLYQGSTINLVLNTTTTFTVYGEGTNGCTGTYMITQNVANCTGIDENGNTVEQFRVYPNPSTGLFYVELSNGVISSVIVTDLAGRVVLNSAVAGGKVSLDLSALSSGVYYAKVSSDKGAQMLRLVKE